MEMSKSLYQQVQAGEFFESLLPVPLQSSLIYYVQDQTQISEVSYWICVTHQYPHPYCMKVWNFCPQIDFPNAFQY